MPYIKQKDRERFDGVLKLISKDALPEDAGELNYLISSICKICIDNSMRNYTAYNNIIGALEGVKLELYDRVLRPYEDKKIEENGDVY